MDAEDCKDINDRRDTSDAQPDVKEQLHLQTLAVLAAEAAARIKALPDIHKDTRLALTTTTTSPNVVVAKLAAINLLGRECNDKPLSQKSDDSDCTLQSDQSENNALKALNTQAAVDKTFTADQTLDRILLAHSEQAIATAHVELDGNSSQRATHELALHGDSGCVKQMSLTTIRDVGYIPSAEGSETAAVCLSGSNAEGVPQTTPTGSVRSIGSLVCRICHNSEDPERLVSPCLCKGSLTYVHIHCLERWISTSRSTVCELCQFQYNTEQTLRYTCFQSLRMWYSRAMSRRALQEDCQMFSLLTLVAFGIIGTLLVGIQYYFLQGQSWLLSRMWTKGWLIFFLFTTLTIYFINIYMILKSQLSPWYRWWQSARDIKLILENRKPFQFRPSRRLKNQQRAQELSDMADMADMAQQQHEQASTTAIAPQESQTHAPQQQPYQPSPPIPPTFAAISIPLHMGSTQESTQPPVSLNGIELQHSGNNGSFGADDDIDTLGCCGKGPKAVTTCKGVAVAASVAFHCNKLTTSATIEIPLESCLYEFETAL